MPGPDIDRAITAAAEKALDVCGIYFKDLVAFRLKKKYETGLETVTLEPERFHETLLCIAGAHATKVLEELILKILLPEMNLSASASTFSQTVRSIKRGELKIASSKRLPPLCEVKKQERT